MPSCRVYKAGRLPRRRSALRAWRWCKDGRCFPASWFDPTHVDVDHGRELPLLHRIVKARTVARDRQELQVTERRRGKNERGNRGGWGTLRGISLPPCPRGLTKNASSVPGIHPGKRFTPSILSPHWIIAAAPLAIRRAAGCLRTMKDLYQ